jgi:hypothetical protein
MTREIAVREPLVRKNPMNLEQRYSTGWSARSEAAALDAARRGGGAGLHPALWRQGNRRAGSRLDRGRHRGICTVVIGPVPEDQPDREQPTDCAGPVQPKTDMCHEPLAREVE